MLRIQDFMSTNVKTINSDAMADEALETMHKDNIHHLVVTSDHVPVGVISRNDLRTNQNNSVADLMSPQIMTLGPSATVREAANKMRGHTIGCIPVMSEKRIVGIVTVSDLLELVGRGIQRAAPKGQRPTAGRRLPAFSKSR